MPKNHRIIDLTGQRFGKLLAVSREKNIRGRVHWLCKCDCGKLHVADSNNLRSGGSQSCGCWRGRNKLSIDETGNVYGLLTVICRAPQTGKGREFCWKCKCGCGQFRIIKGTDLRRGTRKSCGCLKVKRLTTHSLSKLKEYVAWSGMIRRCTDPKCKAYNNYGGRGIMVFKEWEGLEGFSKFYDHIGPKPSPHHSIDRIENDKGYQPGNVKWSTREEQQGNRRTFCAIENYSDAVFLKEARRRGFALVPLILLAMFFISLTARSEEFHIAIDPSFQGLRIFRAQLLDESFSSHPTHELPRLSTRYLSISDGGVVPPGLIPYVSIFRKACANHGLRSNLFLAIALQERVNPAYMNPLGLSNDAGPYHFQSWEEAKGAIERQATLITNPRGPYRNVRSIDDLAAIYSPVGAANDPYHTNSGEGSGIRAHLKKLEGKP